MYHLCVTPQWLDVEDILVLALHLSPATARRTSSLSVVSSLSHVCVVQNLTEQNSEGESIFIHFHHKILKISAVKTERYFDIAPSDDTRYTAAEHKTPKPRTWFHLLISRLPPHTFTWQNRMTWFCQNLSVILGAHAHAHTHTLSNHTLTSTHSFAPHSAALSSLPLWTC